MKNIILVLLPVFFSVYSYAQDLNTIVKRDTSKALIIGGYGEPFAGVTQLNNDWGIMAGIKGGITFNRSFGFGPIAKVNVGLWEFKGNNLNFNDSANLELYMGSAGIFIEYILKMENKIHLSFPVNIMFGGVAIKEDIEVKDHELYDEHQFYDDLEEEAGEVESSGLFIIEPEVNVDFNVAKFFIPSLKIGYRAVFGSQLVNVTDQSLSGAYVGVGLRFGKF